MASVKVTFQPQDRSIDAQTGDKLLEIASRADVDINSLCGGEGVCGKCRVKVSGGKIKLTGKHIGFLERKELEAGYVLACQAEVLDEDVSIWVPPEARKEEEQILKVDTIVQYEPPAPLESGPETGSIPYFRPICRKYFLQLSKPSLADNVSDLERIYRELRKKLGDVPLQIDSKCLRTLARLVRDSDWSVTATVYLGGLECPQVRLIEGGNTSTRNFGVSIDVGTTTIVAQLIDLRTGTIVGVEGSHNRQAHYGEDVISRMIFACSRGGLNPLAEAVTTTINSLLDSLVTGAGVLHEEISCFVAAGNTTMTHLLLDMEPCSIRIAPYIPTASRFPPVLAAELGLKAHPSAMLYCMPCVSSYVGGDITSGVLACGMNDDPQISALIDVGTNGEIVIGNSEWLVCCSASAGPAFEGGGIKCGMRATKGAVEKVSLQGGELSYKTIGMAKPRGICGSGLIDAIAELLAENVIDQSGKFVDLDHPMVRVAEEVPEFIVAPASESETGEPIVVTEDDIGNLIKSKGAILAAMKVLLQNMGMSFENLERIYVAGGFGTHLDIDRAIFIGLLPDIPRERIRFIGNSSLAGARQTLLSSHAYNKAENIAKQMTYFELSVQPDFMNEFVASLFLPHTEMELFPSVKVALAQRRRKD